MKRLGWAGQANVAPTKDHVRFAGRAKNAFRVLLLAGCVVMLGAGLSGCIHLGSNAAERDRSEYDRSQADDAPYARNEPSANNDSRGNSTSNGSTGNSSERNGRNNSGAPSQNNDRGLAANQKDYIGEEAALAVGLEHAHLTLEQVEFSEVKLDYDDGVAEYEVEIYVAGTEYEYDIDAVTGAILSYDTDVFNR